MDENALNKIALEAINTVMNMDPRLFAIERKRTF